MSHIIILGTLDTKLQELLYLRAQILEQSGARKLDTTITLIDCGRKLVEHPAISITCSKLVEKYGPSDSRDLATLTRGEVIRLMTSCATSCVKDLIRGLKVDGLISAGGSGGSSLACAVMREAAPIGMPKLMVSTVASGDTGPLVGETDITMMYSVVDIAGSNSLLRTILGNAAAAIVGMASLHEANRFKANLQKSTDAHKTRIGITMFGVTTPGVDAIRQYLETKYPVEVFVFHATGHGGRAMERLIEEDGLDAVLDLTTTEICDHLMGGNMSAGGDRLKAALRKGLPTVISLGATDMVNFGPRATVPARFEGRKLLEHNPTVTLMRTSAEECTQVGQFIADKILKWTVVKRNVEVWIPEGGVSLIATPGGPFEDAEADAATAKAIREGLKGTMIWVMHDDRDINDAGFAVDIAEALMRMLDN